MIVIKRHHKSISLYNESGHRLPVQYDTIESVFHKLIDSFRIPAYDINCIFVEDDALRNMKIEYFDEDVYTDIISFTLDCSEDFLEGELYISPARIRENASEYNVPVKQEFMRVLIHGFLHLMGYDDATEEEKETMKEREDHFLKEWNYA